MSNTSPPDHVVRLCFHGIGTPPREREPGEAGYWITADTFRRVLDMITGRPNVVVSFDDGNESDFTVGFPELAARGLTAEFYPLAGRLDEPGSLTRSQIRAMADAGMTIGTHGMDHRPWRHLSAAEQKVEFDLARDELSLAAGRDVTLAACPLGSYDRRVISELRSRGYTALMTSDRQWSRPDSWLCPRYSVRSEDSADDVQDVISKRPAVATRVIRRTATLVKSLR